ncbi:hypothetical protein K438DRAFT_1762369 [Mycena galopus ATCC 62051]|nr:hypothetical protein K438DRAFT_1762369 [Mycena galopus ATCC 62051]
MAGVYRLTAVCALVALIPAPAIVTTICIINGSAAQFVGLSVVCCQLRGDGPTICGWLRRHFTHSNLSVRRENRLKGFLQSTLASAAEFPAASGSNINPDSLCTQQAPGPAEITASRISCTFPVELTLGLMQLSEANGDLATLAPPTRDLSGPEDGQ